ncbi:MAG: transposase, partial [Ktedonobacterales bacterium]
MAEAPSPQAVLCLAPVERTLSDAAWERIRPLLPPQKPSTGRPRHDHRMVLSGILTVVGTGLSWREMPA